MKNSYTFNFAIIIVVLGASNGFDLRDSARQVTGRGPIKLVENALLALQNTTSLNITKTCRVHFIEYFQSLLKGQIWALKMFDSSAKIPSGLASINLIEFGSFDECLSVQGFTDVGTICGQYCLGSFPLTGTQDTVENGIIGKPASPDPQGRLSLSLGTCVPASCTTDDITEFYAKIIRVPLNFYEKLCQTKLTQAKMGVGGYATISFFGIIFGLMVISTFYDTHLYYTNKAPPHPVLVAFSALTNIKKLTTPSNPKGQITCLYGIRVFIMLWAIIVHRYQIISDSPVANRLQLAAMITEPIYMYIYTSPVRVDTFLLLAGLVVSYNFMNSYKKGLKFNIFLYYIHRYIRLTPVYAAAILVHANLMEHVGSGPIWKAAAGTQAQFCKDHWWTAILYVQNYANPSEICITPTWNLSVDTQLFLLSPLLLFPMVRWPKTMLTVTGLLAVCTGIGAFLTAFHANFKVFGFINKAGLAVEYLSDYYYPTHIRAGSWLVGIILGYHIHDYNSKESKFRLNKIVVFVLWSIALCILCSCVFGAHNLLVQEHVQVEQSIYAGMVHISWSIGVSWIIYACVTGNGGFINKFLSATCFDILSRLTYAISITHWFALILTTHQMRQSFIVNDLTAMHMFWGDVAFSSTFGLMLVLGFELPMVTIERAVIAPFERKSKKAEPPA